MSVKDQHKKKEEIIRVEGKVIETLPGAQFKVQIDGGHVIMGRVSGKMRMHYIKIVPGDRVVVEMSLYDLMRGRIVSRCKT
ncbi:MAG: translation initiation factor IF-1 [Candidatus Babeliales bacterium]